MISITEHAYEQAKKRFKLKPDSLVKIVERAMESGISHSQKHGQLKRYFDKLFFTHRSANNIRVYGEYVLIICDGSLVTLYQLPNKLRSKVKH